ncbi:MAG: hypothetical protein LBT78_09090, partial [Tannerella sp.]|nr:hypothetical protein [Tannerella sp.]
MKNVNELFLVTLVSAALVSCGNEQLSDTSGEQIPVIGYEGIPTKLWAVEGYSLNDSYKDMADAGFTTNISLDISFHRGEPTPEEYFTTLDAAHANGMKVFASSEAILNFSPEDVSRLVAHPALAGYRVWDEPRVDKYDTVGQVVRRVQAIDNTHPCYVNMFGMVGQSEQLRQFIEKVPVPQLSYDVYPVTLNPDGTRGIKGSLYGSLELFSREAKRANKPFWAFALCFNHWDYPVPTLADLRLQVYSNLAYGAQAITYYSYWSLPMEFGWVKEEFQGPVSRDGKKTEIYYTVQAMNREIKTLSKVFLNANMVWTAYAGVVPKVTGRNFSGPGGPGPGGPGGPGAPHHHPANAAPHAEGDNDHPANHVRQSDPSLDCTPLSEIQLPEAVKSVEVADNRNALVSYMEKGDDRFLVIVNQDLNSGPMQARMTGAKKTYL